MSIVTNKNDSMNFMYNDSSITVNPYLPIEQRFNFAEDLYNIVVADTEDGLVFCEILVDPACKALFLSYCTDIDFEDMNMLQVMDECISSDIADQCINCNRDLYESLIDGIVQYVRDKYNDNKKTKKELIVEGIFSNISSFANKLNNVDVGAVVDVINKFNNISEKEIIKEVVDKS